jgi:hypothetical protein
VDSKGNVMKFKKAVDGRGKSNKSEKPISETDSMSNMLNLLTFADCVSSDKSQDSVTLQGIKS